MNYNPNYFESRKIKARSIFDRQRTVFNPYFQTQILLTAEGFHHLQFSANRERNKPEQLLKFGLLPLAIEIIKKSGTIQEYRKTLIPFGKKAKDGFTKTKNVEYWGLIAIVGDNGIKVKTILRRVGNGSVMFWSVMPCSKLGKQKLADESIAED